SRHRPAPEITISHGVGGLHHTLGCREPSGLRSRGPHAPMRGSDRRVVISVSIAPGDTSVSGLSSNSSGAWLFAIAWLLAAPNPTLAEFSITRNAAPASRARTSSERSHVTLSSDEALS